LKRKTNPLLPGRPSDQTAKPDKGQRNELRGKARGDRIEIKISAMENSKKILAISRR
jgi:hypothetical protein